MARKYSKQSSRHIYNGDRSFLRIKLLAFQEGDLLYAFLFECTYIELFLEVHISILHVAYDNYFSLLIHTF